MSIAVNLSENALTLDDSRTTTVTETKDNSRTATVHIDNENPILEIPISENPLNRFTKQLILNVVGDIKGRPVLTKPFETHTRISIQLSESNLKEDVINAIKEYVHPESKPAY